MQTIVLQRDFLKNPSKGIIYLIIVIALAYMGLLANRKDIANNIISNLSFLYLFKLISTIILPELVSLFILIALINTYHRLMKLECIDLSLNAVARYEFKFAPLFFVAFFFFFPITLHLRFLLREFPNYTLSSYYYVYLINGFSFNTYLFYLPFVFTLGYLLLNISLVNDFSKKNIEKLPLIEKKNGDTPEEQSVDLTNFNARAEKTYINILEVKTKSGTTFLNINDCHYFTVSDDHLSIVDHAEGRFKIVKSMTALEEELDPHYFFRCNRKSIVNLGYTSSFTYLDKGRYNIVMKRPISAEFDITRARMDLYKMALKKYIEFK